MVGEDSDYSEGTLIEQPANALFEELGWETADCFREFEQPGGSPLGRETAAEVVLVPRLRSALEKLNPKASAEAISQAIEELTRDRSRMSPAAANQEIYRLLKDGVKVKAVGGMREQQAAGRWQRTEEQEEGGTAEREDGRRGA